MKTSNTLKMKRKRFGRFLTVTAVMTILTFAPWQLLANNGLINSQVSSGISQKAIIKVLPTKILLAANETSEVVSCIPAVSTINKIFLALPILIAYAVTLLGGVIVFVICLIFSAIVWMLYGLFFSLVWITGSNMESISPVKAFAKAIYKSKSFVMDISSDIYEWYFGTCQS